MSAKSNSNFEQEYFLIKASNQVLLLYSCRMQYGKWNDPIWHRWHCKRLDQRTRKLGILKVDVVFGTNFAANFWQQYLPQSKFDSRFEICMLKLCSMSNFASLPLLVGEIFKFENLKNKRDSNFYAKSTYGRYTRSTITKVRLDILS